MKLAQYSTQREYQRPNKVAMTVAPTPASNFPYARSKQKKSRSRVIAGVAWRARSKESGMRMISGLAEADEGGVDPGTP